MLACWTSVVLTDDRQVDYGRPGRLAEEALRPRGERVTARSGTLTVGNRRRVPWEMEEELCCLHIYISGASGSVPEQPWQSSNRVAPGEYRSRPSRARLGSSPNPTARASRRCVARGWLALLHRSLRLAGFREHALPSEQVTALALRPQTRHLPERPSSHAAFSKNHAVSASGRAPPSRGSRRARIRARSGLTSSTS